MKQEWNLLHFTDLHFGRLENASESLFLDDNKERIASAERDSVIQRFYNILERAKSLLRADAVAVTGDITTQGAADGFNIFASQTMPRLSQLVASPKAVCVVPGNHDVVWNLRKSDPQLFDKKFSSFRRMVVQSGCTTSLLPTGTVGGGPDSTINFREAEAGDATPVYIDPEKKLLVLCINSSIRCGEVNEYRRTQMEEPLHASFQKLKKLRKRVASIEGAAKELDHISLDLKDLKTRVEKQTIFDVPHLTEAQMMRLGSLIAALHEDKRYSAVWDSFLKVAIMHHHLMPFRNQVTEHKPYDIVGDSSRLRQILAEHGFNILLTGHKHQPYASVDESGGHRLLIAGGPTVGGMPARGEQQGFRHLRATYEGGRLSVKITDINLDTATSDNTQIHIRRSMDQAGVEYTVEGDDAPAKLCSIATPKAVLINTDEDLSDESLMFINVVSCREARNQVKSYLRELIRKREIPGLSIVGLYDLYGHYDLLVRVDDASLKGDKGIDLLSRVEEYLETHNMKHKKNGDVTKINLLGGHPFNGGSRKHKPNFFPDQRFYEKVRSHRAFILVTKNSDWKKDELRSVERMALKFYEENKARMGDPNDWLLSWGRRDIVIEVLVRCGQYYNLQELTRRLEDLVDLDDRQKMTHIVYYHEEYYPLEAQSGPALLGDTPPADSEVSVGGARI